MIKRKKIQSIFDQYHSPEYLTIDPLTVVHRFKESEQLPEIAFIAALLSYGRVSQIIQAIVIILHSSNDLSFEFIDTTTLAEKQLRFKDFRYRFHVGDDIALLCEVLKIIRSNHSTLSAFAEDIWKKTGSGELFMEQFTQEIKNFGREFSIHRNYFDWLLPSPSAGSPCKRIAMYLRWMVREDDGIDLGSWSFIPTSELFIPVDSHVAKVSKELGLTSKNTSSWKMSIEITENLKKLCKSDPIKYDFSLCREGMVG